MKLGTQTEERKLFTYEERTKILKRSYKICCRCGRPLTTKNMTVEHVVPLSRGGTNQIENLVALCPQCNKDKGSMIYLPEFYYTAIAGTQLHNQLKCYVKDWFRSIRNDFEIESFHTIAPHLEYIIQLKDTKKVVYNRSFLLRWYRAGSDMIPEIEAVTDLNVAEERTDIRNRRPRKDFLVPPMYVLKKVTNDKLMAVAFVDYSVKDATMEVCLPWVDMAKDYQAGVLMALLLGVLDAIVDTAESPLEYYIVRTPHKSLLTILAGKAVPRIIGCGYTMETIPPKEPEKPLRSWEKPEQEQYVMYIHRTPDVRDAWRQTLQKKSVT